MRLQQQSEIGQSAKVLQPDNSGNYQSFPITPSAEVELRNHTATDTQNFDGFQEQMQELLELERFISPELIMNGEDFKAVSSHIRHVPGTRLANRLIASMLRRRRNDIGKFEFEGKS